MLLFYSNHVACATVRSKKKSPAAGRNDFSINRVCRRVRSGSGRVQSGKVAVLERTAMRARCVMCDVRCPGFPLCAGRDASSMCNVRCLGSALKVAALSAECAMSDVQVWRCVLAAMRGRCAMLEVEVVRCEFYSETRSFQWTNDDGRRTGDGTLGSFVLRLWSFVRNHHTPVVKYW